MESEPTGGYSRIPPDTTPVGPAGKLSEQGGTPPCVYLPPLRRALRPALPRLCWERLRSRPAGRARDSGIEPPRGSVDRQRPDRRRLLPVPVPGRGSEEVEVGQVVVGSLVINGASRWSMRLPARPLAVSAAVPDKRGSAGRKPPQWRVRTTVVFPLARIACRRPHLRRVGGDRDTHRSVRTPSRQLGDPVPARPASSLSPRSSGPARPRHVRLELETAHDERSRRRPSRAPFGSTVTPTPAYLETSFRIRTAPVARERRQWLRPAPTARRPQAWEVRPAGGRRSEPPALPGPGDDHAATGRTAGGRCQ